MTASLIAALKRHESDLILIRQDIHRHPELGFEEKRTAGIVTELLRGWGLAVSEGIAGTGVVATLHGSRPGNRAIALRADMDALPIEEATGLSYASANPGVMHACGHDGHTAMLLGAARYLSEHNDFAGTVHFIFQPAEEGLGGGRVMVEEGLFERFPCEAVYGLHNEPGLPVGAFAIREGPMLAAMTTWTASFEGTGGHGARPYRATDPTLAQAQFVLALQGIIGRNVPPDDAAVLSVGHIAAGSAQAPNNIPVKVSLGGTARTYAPEILAILQRRVDELASGIASAYGCSAETAFRSDYPVLVNTRNETARAADAAAALMGDAAVDRAFPKIMAAEDFAYMLQKKPGAFMLIGNGRAADGTFHHVHTPHYDFNDEILTIGAAYWVTLVQRELAVRFQHSPPFSEGSLRMLESKDH
jgi:hippurate hydrolase